MGFYYFILLQKINFAYYRNTMFKKGGEETDSKMNETQKKDSMLDKAAFH